jgi:hypothetical protein
MQKSHFSRPLTVGSNFNLFCPPVEYYHLILDYILSSC